MRWYKEMLGIPFTFEYAQATKRLG
ncbi:hypothetical protein NYE24_19595 [Paenibacillus sp. FSL H7-0350]